MRKQNRKRVSVMLALFLSVLMLAGCQSEEKAESDSNKLQVITTIFPYYDFASHVAGEYAEVSMAVPAGMDTHSFEPTAADIIAFGKADLLIYNGGEMEGWVEQVIEASDNKAMLADGMMNHVEIYEEEIVEGMEEEEHGHEGEKEYDEHIWTSPVNAQKLIQQIAKDLSKADPEHKEEYQQNADAYKKKLDELDKQFSDVVSRAETRYLVFGDQFPLRYFVEEYDLEYSAAFAGCSADTEPSTDTIAYLTNQVKDKKIPVVLKIELTSPKVAQIIAESTGAEVETFYTCHNVTKEQFGQGVTYLSLMQENVKVLTEALGVTVEKAK